MLDEVNICLKQKKRDFLCDIMWDFYVISVIWDHLKKGSAGV